MVEVKYLDLTSTGHTAQARRTQKRKEVLEQAKRYLGVPPFDIFFPNAP